MCEQVTNLLLVLLLIGQESSARSFKSITECNNAKTNSNATFLLATALNSQPLLRNVLLYLLKRSGWSRRFVYININSMLFLFFEAWIGSLSMALLMCCGPFVGSVINRFGCRAVSISGCVICALSLTVASFAKSLTVLYVAYGVLGIGGGCAFLSGLVIIRKCFDKRQSIALGIASAGQGLGTMALSQVLQSLVTAVHWRNTLRIIAGSLFLNSFFGILYDSKMDTTNSRGVLSREEAGHGRTSKRFTFYCSIWKVPNFLVLIASCFFMMFGRSIIYVLLASIF